MKIPTQIILASSLFLAVLLPSASAQILYSQNFDSPSTPTPVGDFGWSTFFGGSPSNPSINSSGTTSTSLGGRYLFINLNTTNSTSTWFGGLRYIYNDSLPTTDLSQLSLSANILGGGTVGPIGDVVLRIESTTNNWIGFSLPGATLAAAMDTNTPILLGGFLDTTNASAGTFNSSASSFNIVLAFANTTASWGNDASNIIGLNNIEFSVIPEPGTVTLLSALFIGLMVVFRQQFSSQEGSR
jgi:hypothetical protein